MSGAAISVSTSVDGEDMTVGTWHPHPRSGGTFRYEKSWASAEYGYSLSPALPVLAGSAPQVTYAEKGPCRRSSRTAHLLGGAGRSSNGRGRPTAGVCLTQSTSFSPCATGYGWAHFASRATESR